MRDVHIPGPAVDDFNGDRSQDVAFTLADAVTGILTSACVGTFTGQTNLGIGDAVEVIYSRQETALSAWQCISVRARQPRSLATTRTLDAAHKTPRGSCRAGARSGLVSDQNFWLMPTKNRRPKVSYVPTSVFAFSTLFW